MKTGVIRTAWAPAALLVFFGATAAFAQSFTFKATHTAGAGGADVSVEIVDASATTGDDYRVTFQSNGADFDYLVQNVSTSQFVVPATPTSVRSPVFEGLRVTVTPLPSQIEDMVEVRYGGAAVAPPVAIFRPGDHEGEGGDNSTGEYTFVAGDGNGSVSRIARSEANMNSDDYELRFDGNPRGRNKVFHAFTGQGSFDAPFSLWNIGSGTPDDTTDDRQIVAIVFDDSGNPAVYDGGASPSDGGAGTMYDRIYFFEIAANSAGDIDGDGDVDYDDVLADVAANGDISQVIFNRAYLGPEVLARFCLVSLNGNANYLPPVGTTIRITSTKPVATNDAFEFSAPRFGLFTRTLSLDFGQVALDIAGLAPFVVGNRSQSEIAVTNVTFGARQFDAAMKSFTIPPGDSVTLVLSFTPDRIEQAQTTMTLQSNDVFFPRYQVELSGKGARGLVQHLSQTNIAGGAVSDVWGYVDPSGVEYAVVGNLGQGVTVVRVDDPANPTIVSRIDNVPGFDVKVWRRYIYCVNGGAGNGAVIDLVDPENPRVVGQFPSSHNIFITDSGFMVSEFPGLRVFDLNPDPVSPNLIFSGGSEGHDASVVDNVLYDFHGRAGTFIYDFSNPASPQLLSAINDPAIAYNHSGWPSKDGNFLFICDELSNDPSPDIIVYDISDISNPRRVGAFGDPNATVHNFFVKGDFAYVSYYTAGFRIFDVSDPTRPALFDEFDTSPASGQGFAGAFGVYPFAPSGNIYVSDGGSGLHLFSFKDPTTSVERGGDFEPSRFVLFGNYPNPFNPETVIKYQLGASGRARLEIFNIVGQRIRSLLDAEQAAGTHAVKWDGANDAGQRVSSGIYFYKIKTEGFTQTRRMLLLR